MTSRMLVLLFFSDLQIYMSSLFKDTFVPVINLVFLTTDSYRRFASDIIFDRFQTQIVRSRMYLELSQKGIAKRFGCCLKLGLGYPEWDKSLLRLELLEHLYSVARENGLPITIRAPFIFSLQHDLNVSSLFTDHSQSLIVIVIPLRLSLHLWPPLESPWPLCSHSLCSSSRNQLWLFFSS